MNHVRRGAPFGMAVCLGQVALNDQATSVLHQGMTDAEQHRTCAGGFLAETRFNFRRLIEPIGNISPGEAGASYYAALETQAMAA